MRLQISPMTRMTRITRMTRWAAAVLTLMLVPTGAGLGQDPGRAAFTLSKFVDLVVLHTTVVNKNGQIVTNLEQNNFLVRENGVSQPLKVFRKEAVPVTVGLVLDNSASMAPKRQQMMAASRTFMEVFNREDEFFVVNFNQDPYLDLAEKDFTSDPADVEVAMERTATRGTTALFDALRASLDHIRGGTRNKKVVFTVSDGIDSTSHLSFREFYEQVREQNEVALYFLILPCDPTVDDKSECRRAKRHMRRLAAATGGMAYFPTLMGEIQQLAGQIARDIRSQYVLGYEPTDRTKDGAFRRLEVKVNAKGHGKLEARHRPGYYARSDHEGAQ